MMCLRLGRMENDLAYQFGCTKTTVSRFFTKWLNFLYLRLGQIPLWPFWEDVEKCMPECFRYTYPSTFMILHATELRREVPSALDLQSSNYSSYKSHTTVKGLVGIAPIGAFTFISQLHVHWLNQWPATSDPMWHSRVLKASARRQECDCRPRLQYLRFASQSTTYIEHPVLQRVSISPDKGRGGEDTEDRNCEDSHRALH